MSMMSDTEYFRKAIALQHEILVNACSVSKTKSLWFKGGMFASEIVASRPLFSCLDFLIKAPQTTSTEKDTFLKSKQALEPFMERLQRGQFMNAVLVEAVSWYVQSSCSQVWYNDLVGRGCPPFAASGVLESTEYTDEESSAPLEILSSLRRVLVTGVVVASYLNGRFSQVITKSTKVLVGLTLLDSDTQVPEAHQTVFRTAKKEVQKLNSLIREGKKGSWPKASDYLDAKIWLDAVIGVFNDDAESRGVEKPEWHMVYLLDWEFGKGIETPQLLKSIGADSDDE